MKLFTASALTLLAASAAYGQGIFNIVPHDYATEPLPLQYHVTVAAGYDDNVTPLSTAGDQDATYGRVELGATYVAISPQTNFNLDANVNYTYYFDNIQNGDDSHFGARVALNVAHSVSEKLRLVTRNFANYGLEPDYQYGAANDRSNKEYLYLSTENSVGYKWTERFATYTGIRYDVIDYDSANIGTSGDRENFTVFNQFRYISSPQTVLTLDYRYRWADNEGGRDSDNQYILLGAEHRVSANSVVVARAGAQIREVDGGDDSTNPFFELGYRSRINEQFNVRAWARYAVEDLSNVVGNVLYDNSESLRLSVAGTYVLSPAVTLTGGVNYIRTDYTDAANNVASDVDVDLINLYLGASYKINDCYSANITYNYTTSDSDSNERDYDRNRVQVGVTYSF